jgi:hypothetical protein
MPSFGRVGALPVFCRARRHCHLACSGADQIWTSCAYAQAVMAELRAAHAGYPHVLLDDPNGGHGSAVEPPYEPGLTVTATAATLPGRALWRTTWLGRTSGPSCLHSCGTEGVWASAQIVRLCLDNIGVGSGAPCTRVSQLVNAKSVLMWADCHWEPSVLWPPMNGRSGAGVSAGQLDRIRADGGDERNRSPTETKAALGPRGR